MRYFIAIANNRSMLREKWALFYENRSMPQRDPAPFAAQQRYLYHPLVEKYVTVEKKEGETPLQALERYRSKRPDLAGIPMTYAGRLDPMASGLLVLLIGEECKNRDAYTGLDKEYEFEILFGAATDTGDILGLLKEFSMIQPGVPYEEIIQEGVYTLPYPAYSSKTVGGIPLFRYALENKLHDIRIPERDMTVLESGFIGSRTMTGTVIRAEVMRRIGLLTYDEFGPKENDFREHKVRASWEDFPDGVYTLARYRVRVTGGTYIRSLVDDASRRMRMPALAYSIKRTRIIRLP
jgi:tRNA pseudouridine(55) synthase